MMDWPIVFILGWGGGSIFMLLFVALWIIYSAPIEERAALKRAFWRGLSGTWFGRGRS